jgi:type VI secretion system secreted protein VgrG
VAGAAGEIHTDALHRVRVQFHWQRNRAGGGGDSDDSNSPHTAWLRVASRYAGKGMGAQFVPRIGQEVVVGFMDGDIDHPVVLGSVYNGQGDGGAVPTPGGETAGAAAAQSPFAQSADHRPAAQGNLAQGNSPAWHGEASAYAEHRNRAALSGFKSAEFNQPYAGYNQLVFDDSDMQQRIQLATTQASTQLNLGHLVHQADNYRGSHRGDGFELRTDAYGALRAARGALFSTWPIQTNLTQTTSEPAADATAPIALLKQATQLAGNTSQIGTTHKTVAVAAHLGSSKAGSSVLDKKKAAVSAQQRAASGMLDTKFDAALSDAGNKATSPSSTKIPHSTDPLLTFAAKGGLGLVAGQNLQFANGEAITFASGKDSNFALADKLRIHAGQALGLLASAQGAGSLKLIAAQGPILAQAQADAMTLASKAQLKMVAVNGDMTLAASKKINIAVKGGSAITIESGKITVQCPGTLTVHAGQKSFVGGGKVDATLPQFSQGPLAFNFKRRFVFSV